MSGTVHLPPAEPPAEGVAGVLEELRAARREMADAAHLLRLLAIDRHLGGQTAHARLKHWIETQTAERRCELWAVRIRQLEEKAREIGLRP